MSTPGRHKQKGGPLTCEVTGRPTHQLPGARGFTPTVLLPVAAAGPDAAAVGRTGAPASIPKRLGPAARFASAGAASQPGRGPASHAAHRGATSVWVRHATGLTDSRGVATRIDGRPKPLFASAPSPEFPRSEPVTQGVAETGSQPFPCATDANLRPGRNRASADVSSAYGPWCVGLWKPKMAGRGASGGPFHPMWTCA